METVFYLCEIEEERQKTPDATPQFPSAQQQQAQVVMGRLKTQGGEKKTQSSGAVAFPSQYADGLNAYDSAVLQCTFSS